MRRAVRLQPCRPSSLRCGPHGPLRSCRVACAVRRPIGVRWVAGLTLAACWPSSPCCSCGAGDMPCAYRASHGRGAHGSGGLLRALPTSHARGALGRGVHCNPPPLAAHPAYCVVLGLPYLAVWRAALRAGCAAQHCTCRALRLSRCGQSSTCRAGLLVGCARAGRSGLHMPRLRPALRAMAPA